MRRTPTRRLVGALVAITAVLSATACTATPPALSHHPVVGPSANHGYTKVLVIVDENYPYRQIIGEPDAPYVTTIAGTYGSATNMPASYSVACPSLAAYAMKCAAAAASTVGAFHL